MHLDLRKVESIVVLIARNVSLDRRLYGSTLSLTRERNLSPVLSVNELSPFNQILDDISRFTKTLRSKMEVVQVEVEVVLQQHPQLKLDRRRTTVWKMTKIKMPKVNEMTDSPKRISTLSEPPLSFAHNLSMIPLCFFLLSLLPAPKIVFTPLF